MDLPAETHKGIGRVEKPPAPRLRWSREWTCPPKPTGELGGYKKTTYAEASVVEGMDLSAETHQQLSMYKKKNPPAPRLRWVKAEREGFEPPDL